MYKHPTKVAAGTAALAFTGVNLGWTIMLAMLLVAVGAGLLRLVPRPQE